MAKQKSKVSRILIAVMVNSVILISIILFTPGLPPNIRFESYKLKPPQTLKSNSILDKAELVLSGEFVGPESIAQRGNEIFTGVTGGHVIRIKDGVVSNVVQFGECEHAWDTEECGRPLGMRFDSNGKLIVADAYFGIHRVDVDEGTSKLLVPTTVPIGGQLPKIPDDLDISKSGLIYWSDASTDANLHEGYIEYFGGPSGRILVYDEAKNESKVLVDDVHFANGVQLSKDEDFLMYAETMRARVWRYWLKGPKQGTHEILVDSLPGLPDNIRPNGKGTGYYVSLIVYRDKFTLTPGDTFGGMPLIRKLILRLQGLALFLLDKVDAIDILKQLKYYVGHLGPLGHPESKKTVIVEINDNGEIIGSLQTERGKMTLVTEVSVGKEYTYFGSFSEDKLWRIKTSELK